LATSSLTKSLFGMVSLLEAVVLTAAACPSVRSSPARIEEPGSLMLDGDSAETRSGPISSTRRTRCSDSSGRQAARLSADCCGLTALRAEEHALSRDAVSKAVVTDCEGELSMPTEV